MRAILEGVGYALLSISEIVEANSGVCKKVVASGGFIKSPDWVQMVTDLLGKSSMSWVLPMHRHLAQRCWDLKRWASTPL